MILDDLLRKLAPLIPEDVQHWRRTLPLVNEKTRDLLEKHIHWTASELLGSWHDRLLLPPPPPAKLKGPLNLGTVLYTKEWGPCSITKAELLNHMVILGRSGAGKTNLVFHLLQQLVHQKIPFLFLDWKRTARHLLPQIPQLEIHTPGRAVRPFLFNPFLPPPETDANVYTNLLLDLFSAAYTLGDGAKNILQQAITEAYRQTAPACPTVQTVLEVTRQLPLKNRALGWQQSAVRALATLDFSQLGTTEAVDQATLVRSLLKGHTVIELNGINENAKRFLIPCLLTWIYQQHLNRPTREELSCVLILEEAHHILRRTGANASDSVIERFLRQCRELGIGMIIVDQHPSLLSKVALGNTYTTICFNLKEPADVDRAAGLLLLQDRDRSHLATLPVGQAIVRLQDRWSQPFLVQVPHHETRKGSVTDDVLRSVSTAGSARKRALVLPQQQVRQIRLEDHLDDDAICAFLLDVQQHPEDGVKERYKRLGLSADKGNQLKQQLITAGVLESQLIALGTTRKTVLRVTTEASRVLPSPASSSAVYRESIAHEYWKRAYARHLEALGYAVTIEAARTRGSGRIDVLAKRDGERLAIEIETGKSDVVDNVKRDLAMCCRHIFVVATDAHACQTVEQQLYRAGLLLPQRVTVLLRDEGIKAGEAL